MPRKAAKTTKRTRKPLAQTGAGTIVEHVEEVEVFPAPAGTRSLRFTLHPKVLKLEPQVEYQGKSLNIRMDKGFVYHLPVGLQWLGRDGNGDRGLPASILFVGDSQSPPVDLHAITPAQVAAYRLTVRGPRVARLKQYLKEQLGEDEGNRIAYLGENAVISTYNALAVSEGKAAAEVAAMLPAPPAGVTVMTPAMDEVLDAEFSPTVATTPQSRVEEAFAEAPSGTRSKKPAAEAFFDAEADDTAEASVAVEEDLL